MLHLASPNVNFLCWVKKKKSPLISANVLTKCEQRQSSAVILSVPSGLSKPGFQLYAKSGFASSFSPRAQGSSGWKKEAHLPPSHLSGGAHCSKASLIKTNLWSCQTSTDLHFKSGPSFEQTLSKRKNELWQEPPWIKHALLSIQTGTTELWWIISAGGNSRTRIKRRVGGAGAHLKTLPWKRGWDQRSALPPLQIITEGYKDKPEMGRFSTSLGLVQQLTDEPQPLRVCNFNKLAKQAQWRWT